MDSRRPVPPDGPAAEPRAPVPPVIAVEDLTVTLDGGDQRALIEKISFTVGPGETVCIVGESGSGKSVTSLAIMGLLPRGSLSATGGSVIFEGEDILRLDAAQMRKLRASRLAMIFQEPMTALNPVQGVGRQVDEVLRVHLHLPASERRKQVLEMFRAVHLPDPERIYRAYPHELSGGQRQRIMIAMALILHPKVLIADEPTTALDVTTQQHIITLIKELQQEQGTAVIFITHDFGVVADIADRIVVVNQGHVVETGSRDAILSRPGTAYTRMLVSAVPSLIPRPQRELSGKEILKVSGLEKVYGRSSWLGGGRHVHAAADVALSVRSGEVVGIVGESGSGKSTVARCIVRLIEPTAGQVLLNGSDLTQVSRLRLRAYRKQVQVIFQDPYRSLNPRLRIGASLIEGLVNFGMSRSQARQKVSSAMELVGLGSDFLDRFPHQLSGGQRQRVCIARAVVMEPDLLVADEAVSALDVSVQAQVLDLLEAVRERTGVSILFITHDLRVAAQVCDTIVVMQSGRIVEQGPAADILTAPKQEYTRALIGAAPGGNWDFKNFRALGPVTP